MLVLADLVAGSYCGSSPSTRPGSGDAGPEGADVSPSADEGEAEGSPDDDDVRAGDAADADGALDAGPDAGEASEVDAEEPFVEHVVQEGETLWDIAMSYGVSVDAILRANHLRADRVRRLSKGRVLRIPGVSAPVAVLDAAARAEAQRAARAALPPLEDGAYHFVGSGETLWEIARTYGKTVDELSERNGFTDDEIRALSVGTPVIIPGITDDQIQTADAVEPTGIRHILASGETIWDLASAFQVGVGQIMAANRLSADDAKALREGTELWSPGVSEARNGRVRREGGASARGATSLARRLGLGTHDAAIALLAGRVKESWIEAAGGDELPGTLRWPVSNGWYVRGWGSGEGGYHLATDVMGEMGWNVRASAAGIVGYSGNEVRGYGNMVILIHPGGWVTMYAHNSANFVVAGQRVPAGGIIAELGSTGISRGPHVHFEFIYKGKNCDPEVLFRPGVRHRNGHIQELHYATWTDPDDRPAAVRCAPRRHHPRSRWVQDELPGDEPPSEGTPVEAPGET
ncbi:MAG: LysM peptidoglycan-binding domain-containing M23 family metallopeptidase [Deltaproteobacteria bacterium]|nr:LysM peptidoglycan-binding domain-containing M23 family metallopeptidase [Deltaproteobacteria bacterium]